MYSTNILLQNINIEISTLYPALEQQKKCKLLEKLLIRHFGVLQDKRYNLQQILSQ